MTVSTCDVFEQGEVVAGDADPSDDALALERPQGRQGFVQQLASVAMLYVVALQHVDVVDAETREAGVQAAQGGVAREVPILVAIAAHLGHQDVVVARRAAQGDAQGRLGAGQAVIGRDIDQIDAGLQRGGDHFIGFGLRYVLIDAAQRGSAERQRGHQRAVAA